MPVFPIRVIQTSPSQEDVTVPITLPNFATLVNFSSTNTGVVITPSSIRASQTININLPRVVADEEETNEVITVDCEYIYQDGSRQTSQIVILRI
jgi:hypothetical protein